MRYLIFDTETSDLISNRLKPIARQPSIIEFAAVLATDGTLQPEKPVVLDELSQLIHPGFKVTPETTKMTGITNDMLKGQPTWPQAAPSIIKFIERADAYVGQNIVFDLAMLELEMQRHDIAWRWPAKPKYCTIECSEHIMGRAASLSDLHAHFFGAAHASAHRAMPDVLATMRVFWALKQQGAV